jgi:hypothetical protein
VSWTGGGIGTRPGRPALRLIWSRGANCIWLTNRFNDERLRADEKKRTLAERDLDRPCRVAGGTPEY